MASLADTEIFNILHCFMTEFGATCWQKLGKYSWDCLGKSPTKAASGRSIHTMLPLLRVLFEKFPSGHINFCPLEKALSQLLPLFRVSLEYTDLKIAVASLAGSLKTLLLHCRRIHAQPIKFNQATRDLPPGHVEDIREVLSMLVVPAKSEEEVDHSSPVKEEVAHSSPVKDEKHVPSSPVKQEKAISGSPVKREPGLDIWSQEYDTSRFCESISGRGGLRELARTSGIESSGAVVAASEPPSSLAVVAASKSSSSVAAVAASRPPPAQQVTPRKRKLSQPQNATLAKRKPADRGGKKEKEVYISRCMGELRVSSGANRLEVCGYKAMLARQGVVRTARDVVFSYIALDVDDKCCLF